MFSSQREPLLPLLYKCITLLSLSLPIHLSFLLSRILSTNVMRNLWTL